MLAAAGAAVAVAFAPLAAPASAAYCEIRVAGTCVVENVCETVAAPIHTADAALGSPLGGHPYCGNPTL
jgi:hypothetical protein